MTTTADQMARQTTRAPDHMTIFGQVLIGSRRSSCTGMVPFPLRTLWRCGYTRSRARPNAHHSPLGVAKPGDRGQSVPYQRVPRVHEGSFVGMGVHRAALRRWAGSWWSACGLRNASSPRRANPHPQHGQCIGRSRRTRTGVGGVRQAHMSGIGSPGRPVLVLRGAAVVGQVLQPGKLVEVVRDGDDVMVDGLHVLPADKDRVPHEEADGCPNVGGSDAAVVAQQAWGASGDDDEPVQAHRGCVGSDEWAVLDEADVGDVTDGFAVDGDHFPVEEVTEFHGWIRGAGR
jgi:hypothetical protein